MMGIMTISRFCRTCIVAKGAEARFRHAASKRCKATVVASNSDTRNEKVHSLYVKQHNEHIQSVPNFSDAQAAFESKTTFELLRAWLVFRLCGVKPLVSNAKPLLQMSRRFLGDYITDGMLKATLFGHFCAGEDEKRIQPAIADLRRSGIGGILDFAAESDIEEESTTEYNQPAREYSYESEAACSRHVEVFRSCIRSVANISPDGFAAIKVTALGNPVLLERMSVAIVEIKNLFGKFDVDHDGFVSRDEFERAYRYFFHDADNNLPKIFGILDPNDTGIVDYITWSKMLTPKDLPEVTKRCREMGPLGRAAPTEEEVELMTAMHNRAHLLASEAAACGTRLLIDAEQFRYQPAIDNLTLELQQTYNATDKTDTPIIFNTYQCYLKDTLERIKLDIERSERFSFHFATKLVRGAYMESERERATETRYPSPIHETIEDTHQTYNNAVEFLLRHSTSTEKRVEIMCATHNQESIEKALAVMNECNIQRSEPVLHFAQLYGMSDNLTYNLGKNGFRAYKYVPYGEVKEVIAYLIRRAQENSAMMKNGSRELQLLNEELFRRFRASINL